MQQIAKHICIVQEPTHVTRQEDSKVLSRPNLTNEKLVHLTKMGIVFAVWYRIQNAPHNTVLLWAGLHLWGACVVTAQERP